MLLYWVVHKKRTIVLLRGGVLQCLVQVLNTIIGRQIINQATINSLIKMTEGQTCVLYFDHFVT